MSTSESVNGALPGGADLLTARDGDRTLPFAQVLERLANQMLSGFPGGGLDGSNGVPRHAQSDPDRDSDPTSRVGNASPLLTPYGDPTRATATAAGIGAGAPGSAAAPGAGMPRSMPAPILGAPSPFNETPRLTSPPFFGPSALQPGLSGASSALTLPPFPGPALALPPASAPPPRESDLRNLPALFGESLGFSSPVALAQLGPNPAPGAASDQPYFLERLAPRGGGASAPGSTSTSTSSYASAPTPDESPRPSHAPVPSPLSHSVNEGARAPLSPFGGFNVQPEVVPDRGSAPGLFDPQAVKRDFPILNERVHGKPLIWFDNAATTQKPRAVIDRLSHYYEHENSNIHRAAHALAARATDAYEGARDKVRRFLGAPSPREIVFVRGATEAINLVAQSWGRRNVSAGDEIVITWLEHHANIVPWQQLCAEKGARLCVAPVDGRGQVILEEFEKLLGPRTRLVSFTQVSNALGTILPAREMVQMAHRHGARVLVDGAQAVSHMPVDVQDLDCDFYCFSGHKVFAPTGIGVLFGKESVLEAMPPWQGGGNMISDVTFEKTTYQPPPLRFEAGTGNIGDAVGLGAAIDYVNSLGLENIRRYEHDLLGYATQQLARVPGLRMIGTAQDKAGVVSFVLDGWRTEDVGAALDREGIAVRSGHHCAQPILRRFGLESTVRASLAPYNTCDDVDALVSTLLRLQVGRPSAPPSSAKLSAQESATHPPGRAV